MIIPEQIITRSEKYGIHVNPQQAGKIALYSNMVIEYNQHTNLTRNDSEEKMLDKNIIDSLRLIPYIKEKAYVADIGCGAGFPGVIVAVMCDIRIILIDSIKKKTDFLKEVIYRIGINAEVINDRVENIAHKEQYREQFDCVISRAAAPLNMLIEYSVALLKINGDLIAMKGPNVREEVEGSNKALYELKSEITDKIQYHNYDGIERYLIFIKKNDITNKIYPRNTKKIIKQPL